MAKKQASEGVTAAALVEVATVDERVSEVFGKADTPDAREQWLADAREAQAVMARGAISPEVLKALVGRAVGLLER